MDVSMERSPAPERLRLAIVMLASLAIGCSGGGPDGGRTGTATSTLGPAATTLGGASSVIPSSSGTAPGAARSGRAPTPSSAPAVPAFEHVYVIVMENRESDAVVGSPDAPYLNSLIARGGLATNYHGVSHPSQPNYFALFAGTTFGIRDDDVHDLTATHLADQLEAHGRSWHVYAQNLPAPCATTARAFGGRDLVGAAGWYVRKHEPAISFTDISSDPARCARITRLAAFDPDAADFELIVPNQTNDMHDGSTAQGDAFLRAFVPLITDREAFARSLLVITFDEGTTNAGGGGRIATVLVSPLVPAGTTSAVAHDHYSLLRTIENAWGLGCLANSCDANDLRELLR